MPKTSIIVPAFNEEQGISPTLEDVRSAVNGFDVEIIVIDDGSTDKTAELAKGYADLVIKHTINQGKGAAMRSGYQASSGEYVMFIDADGTYPAEYIPSIIRKLDEVDIVFTSRSNKEHIPLLNRFGNWSISTSIRKLTGFVGNDPLSGLYGMRREVLDAIGLESSTFAIETEIVVKASRMRFRASEIPITYRPRLGESKLRPLRDGWRILKVLIDLLFIFQPYLTFVLPGILIFLMGAFLAGVLVIKGTVIFKGIHLGLNSFSASVAFMLFGLNIATYGGIIDLYATRHRFKKPSSITIALVKLPIFSALRNSSMAVLTISLLELAYLFFSWANKGFGPFLAARAWMLALTGLLLGLQGVFTSIIGRIFAKDCLKVDEVGSTWAVLDNFIASIRYRKVKKLIPLDSIICDLGCGFDGNFLQKLSSLKIKGYGFDRKVNEIMAIGNITLSPLDLEKGIPLADESVDCVTMLALLEHLDKAPEVLQEVFRILKHAGRVVLTTPSPRAKSLLEFLAFKLKLIAAEEISDHKHYFSGNEIRWLLDSIGFESISVEIFQLGFNQIATGFKLIKEDSPLISFEQEIDADIRELEKS